MILVIETGRVYEETFKKPVPNDNPLWFCDPETRKAMQNYLKNTKPESLAEKSARCFSTWKEFEEAAKERTTLPGNFFIKEIK